MLRSIIRTRTARVLLAAGVLLALTAGGASATGGLGSVVGADGVIHGCYQRYNGDLHIVAADATSCPSGQLPIAWSQTGPKGDTGDPGAPFSVIRSGSDVYSRDPQEHLVQRLRRDPCASVFCGTVRAGSIPCSFA